MVAGVRKWSGTTGFGFRFLFGLNVLIVSDLGHWFVGGEINFLVTSKNILNITYLAKIDLDRKNKIHPGNLPPPHDLARDVH